jgi:hypothetical protein
MNQKQFDVVIEFHGVCGHFRGVVPDVPHRVVLPEAFEWRPGVIIAPEPSAYLLQPHAAVLADGERKPYPDVPNLIESGWITSAVRLEIANACDQLLEYPGVLTDPVEAPFDTTIPKLASYSTSEAFSDEVVRGGRAACYFDVFCGRVTAFDDGGARHTRIAMKTSGPPLLRVTPLHPSNDCGPVITEIPVGARITVGNVGLSCDDGQYDFLWHLQATEGGIGQYLPRLPFGLSSTSTPWDMDCMLRNFEKLLTLRYPRPRVSPHELLMWETTASCSNSQYP